jgi:hypothetical protein
MVRRLRSTGYLHPHLSASFGNYYSLLTDLSLSQEDIGKRIFVELGQEAGFDSESYREVPQSILEQE